MNSPAIKDHLNPSWVTICVRMTASLTVTIFGSQALGLSLQEALAYSFANNPKTQANTLRIDGAKLQTQAVKDGLLPNLSLSYNDSRSNSESTRSGTTTNSQSESQGVNVSTSVNLYNGGADLLRIKASELNDKAMEARYNSTNSFISSKIPFT